MRKTSTVISVITLIAAFVAVGLARRTPEDPIAAVMARSSAASPNPDIDYMAVGSTRQIEHLRRLRVK